MNAKKHSPTVLLADDEDLFLSSATDALVAKYPDYRVLAASDGQQAMEAFNSVGGKVDIVVTDIKMPVMGGLELLLELRRAGFRGPTLVVTAFGDPALEQQVRELGALNYLGKPLDLDQLIDAISGAVEGGHSHVEGFSLPGFVQLLEVERKTCLLRISQGEEIGDLMFRKGELVDAHVGERSGEAAALALLAWGDGVRLDLHAGVRPRRRTIDRPLNRLLLEAMRLEDESNRDGHVLDAEDAEDAVETQSSESLEVSPQTPTAASGGKEIDMSNTDEAIKEAMEIDGAKAVALVDYESGMTLGQAGGGDDFNLDIAAAGNTEVVRSKMGVMKNLGLKDNIEDILITLSSQYHLIRPLSAAKNLFLYLVLDRKKSNLAMARHKLASLETNLKV